MQKTRNRTCQFGSQKIYLITFASAIVFLFAHALQSEANIYSWTDSNGVKHFSNSPPPSDQNSSIEVHQEIAYDRKSDEERLDMNLAME